jgi:hypothetical protein
MQIALAPPLRSEFILGRGNFKSKINIGIENGRAPVISPSLIRPYRLPKIETVARGNIEMSKFFEYANMEPEPLIIKNVAMQQNVPAYLIFPPVTKSALKSITTNSKDAIIGTAQEVVDCSLRKFLFRASRNGVRDMINTVNNSA